MMWRLSRLVERGRTDDAGALVALETRDIVVREPAVAAKPAGSSNTALRGGPPRFAVARS
jgi:hypothetical protein